MPSAKTTTPSSFSLAISASRPPPKSSPSERITSTRCFSLPSPNRRSAVSIPGASSVPGVGSEPGSMASSSRSITPPSRVSGASATESPSVCTSPTRLPGISRVIRRTSDLATNRRDGARVEGAHRERGVDQEDDVDPLALHLLLAVPPARPGEGEGGAEHRQRERGHRERQPPRREGRQQPVPEAAGGPGGVRRQPPAPEPDRRRRRRGGEQGEPEEVGDGEGHGSAVTWRPAAARGRRRRASPAQTSGGKASRSGRSASPAAASSPAGRSRAKIRRSPSRSVAR